MQAEREADIEVPQEAVSQVAPEAGIEVPQEAVSQVSPGAGIEAPQEAVSWVLHMFCSRRSVGLESWAEKVLNKPIRIAVAKWK